MPQMSDTKNVAGPNIQDAFLNLARRDRLQVRVRLMDGTELDARIKNFDRFAVIVEHEGVDYLLFKHAVATIRAPRALASYFVAHDAR